MNELEFVFEVVNPESGAPVADGERGELVVTNLGRPEMPVVRYRTGDLVVRTSEPCSCGRRMARLAAGVGAALARAFRSRLAIRVEVVEAAAGALPRYELKARRSNRLP